MKSILLILCLILCACEQEKNSKINTIVGKNYNDCICQFEWGNPQFSFDEIDLYEKFPEYKTNLHSLDDFTLWKLKCKQDFLPIKTVNPIS